MMHKLIAWLLERYTDFRVAAWSNGRIAAIGTPAFTHNRLNYWDRTAGLACRYGISAPTVITGELLSTFSGQNKTTPSGSGEYRANQG